MADPLTQALHEGIRHHQAGRLQQAEQIYRRVLQQQPDHGDALHLLGLLAHDTGHHDEAVKLIRRALDRAPGNAAYHCSLGNVYRSQGNLEAAVTAYRRALRHKPDHVAALNNLGNTLSDLARNEEAALVYRKALQYDPCCAPLYNNLGFVLEASGALDDALLNYRRALELGGREPDILNNVANVLCKQEQYGEAIPLLQEIIRDFPQHPAAYLSLGNALMAQDEHQEALSCLQQAARLDPGKAEVHCSLGNALLAMGEGPRAVDSLNEALRLDPESAEAVNSLGCAWHFLGDFDAARDSYRRALELRPDYTEARFNLALIDLLQGDFQQGWAGYEAGLHTTFRNLPHLPLPCWEGVAAGVGAVLVYGEQGIGDEIMFASCLPDLVKTVPEVVLACNERLRRLFSRSFPHVNVVAGMGREEDEAAWLARLPKVDAWLGTGSLPRHFRPDAASFPRQHAFLVADEARVQAWKARYEMLGTGLTVGISWRGGNKPHVRALRSIALPQWREILRIPGVRFVNLQYGHCQEELDEVRSALGVTVHHWDDSDPLGDLDDFAAQVKALDLVISVDNSTVHMAGALGVPVWTLLPASADWRWLQAGDDTLWYESVKLYRQEKAGAWQPVVQRVARDLGDLVAGFTPRQEA